MGFSFANVEECSVCEKSENNRIVIFITCITFFSCPQYVRGHLFSALWEAKVETSYYFVFCLHPDISKQEKNAEHL